VRERKKPSQSLKRKLMFLMLLDGVVKIEKESREVQVLA